MDIEGLGERQAMRFLEEDLIDDVADIYDLTAERLEGLEGFARISAENLVESIERSKQRAFGSVLFALGIPGIGGVNAEALARYPAARDVVWVQEEPKNMGAYRHVQTQVRERLELDLPYVGRDANATPAVASHRMHHQEQEKIMITAIGLPTAGEETPDIPPGQIAAAG